MEESIWIKKHYFGKGDSRFVVDFGKSNFSEEMSEEMFELELVRKDGDFEVYKNFFDQIESHLCRCPEFIVQFHDDMKKRLVKDA